MYIVSEVVEMGNAQELILHFIKEVFHVDDAEPYTLSAEDDFDE